MKAINANYAVIEKIEEEKGDGFRTVEVQDSFIYKGRVKQLPNCPLYVDSHILEVGDVVLFSKYSPDTHDIEGDKYVKNVDILAVI